MRLTAALLIFCIPAVCFGLWSAIPYLVIAAICVFPFELTYFIAAGPEKSAGQSGS